MTRIISRLAHFLRQDIVGGVLLIAATTMALTWANLPSSDTFTTLRDTTIGPASLNLDLSLQAWAADGLLAIFFFIVGNELKQEFVHGQLRDPRHARVPVIAAVCGTIAPAGIFVLFNLNQPHNLHGWGIPMATDIAFAIAILAILGRHLPRALRTFLLTLAVTDDLIAIIVIAIFYTGGINTTAFIAALIGLAVFAYLQYGRRNVLARVPRVIRQCVYIVLALVIWSCVHSSGIHATIAGVAIGLLMRTSTRNNEKTSPSDSAERTLRPWAMGLALPLFAFMSTGVTFDNLIDAMYSQVTLGIAAALVIGKLVGIAGGAWLAVRITRGHLDPSLSWLDIVGVSQLAGIGFTVSLLIAELSYPTNIAQLTNAKTGVLLGSLIAIVSSAILLSRRNRHYHLLSERRPISSVNSD